MQMQHKTAPITSVTPIIHISRHYVPCCWLMVRNLPPTVKSSQLKRLFSKHGEVCDAEVLYNNKKKKKLPHCLAYRCMPIP